MRKESALKMMFAMLGSLLVFHTLIITEVIPYDKVWAGKLNSVEEMIRFESVSIIVNTIMLIVFIIKYRLIMRSRNNRFIDILIWIIAGFFFLNAVGNLFSNSVIELILGTGLTCISAVLCFIIAKKPNAQKG